MKVRKIVTENELKERIKKIAEDLKKYSKAKDITLLGILRGGIIFVSELMKNMNSLGLNPNVEFVVVRKDEEKNIHIVDFPSKDIIKDKIVVVTDDLIKSGETLIKVIDEVKKHNPKQILSATLVLKENAMIKPDTFGFSSSDTEYWVGFGMDYQGKFRNLEYLGEVVEEEN